MLRVEAMNCEQCGVPLPESRYARLRWERERVNIPIRCRYCGLPHVRGEAISHHLYPIDTAGRRAPWRPHMYRPVLPGWYDCRFRSTEPYVLKLWWNGSRFQHNGQNVSMLDFMGFRGVWK